MSRCLLERAVVGAGFSPGLSHAILTPRKFPVTALGLPKLTIVIFGGGGLILVNPPL